SPQKQEPDRSSSRAADVTVAWRAAILPRHASSAHFSRRGPGLRGQFEADSARIKTIKAADAVAGGFSKPSKRPEDAHDPRRDLVQSFDRRCPISQGILIPFPLLESIVQYRNTRSRATMSHVPDTCPSSTT